MVSISDSVSSVFRSSAGCAFGLKYSVLPILTASLVLPDVLLASSIRYPQYTASLILRDVLLVSSIRYPQYTTSLVLPDVLLVSVSCSVLPISPIYRFISLYCFFRCNRIFVWFKALLACRTKGEWKSFISKRCASGFDCAKTNPSSKCFIALPIVR